MKANKSAKGATLGEQLLAKLSDPTKRDVVVETINTLARLEKQLPSAPPRVVNAHKSGGLPSAVSEPGLLGTALPQVRPVVAHERDAWLGSRAMQVEAVQQYLADGRNTEDLPAEALFYEAQYAREEQRRPAPEVQEEKARERLRRMVDDGSAALSIPKVWGNSPGAQDARAHGAERVGRKGGVQVVFAEDRARTPRDVPPPRPEFTEIVKKTIERVERDGSVLRATVESVDPDEAPSVGAAAPDRPEMYDQTTSRTIGWARAANKDLVRGLDRARRLYQTHPIVGSVGQLAPSKMTQASVTSSSAPQAPSPVVKGKVAIGKSATEVPARKAQDLAAVSVKTKIGLSDIEAARLKKSPYLERPALCDARKAPPRGGPIAADGTAIKF